MGWIKGPEERMTVHFSYVSARAEGLTHLRGFLGLEFIGLQRDLLLLADLSARCCQPGMLVEFLQYLGRVLVLELRRQPGFRRGVLLAILRPVIRILGVIQIGYYLEWVVFW